MAAKKKGAKRAAKDVNINIRVTADQKAELTRAAERAGISLSSWVVATTLREARKADGDGRA
jgi:uncharacterized protein (DUF1778 family)